jgi:hypothetical protein
LIRCVSIRWNTADDFDSTFRGLFYARMSVTISESAIAGNTATLLVLGQSGFGRFFELSLRSFRANRIRRYFLNG